MRWLLGTFFIAIAAITITIAFGGRLSAEPPASPANPANPASSPSKAWQVVKAEAGLPPHVELSRSPDRRCSLAIVTTTEAKSRPETLEAALAGKLELLGFTVSKAGKRGRIERGSVAGQYVLGREQDSGDAAWHLRACFYRKRDENVCQSSCEKLL